MLSKMSNNSSAPQDDQTRFLSNYQEDNRNDSGRGGGNNSNVDGRRPRVVFPPSGSGRRHNNNNNNYNANGNNFGLRAVGSGRRYSSPRRADFANRDTSTASVANGQRADGGRGAGGRGNNRTDRGGPPQNRRGPRRPNPSKFSKNRKDHAGIPMTGLITDCLICCQRSDLYAIGFCLHPMCMECAIRARILGKSNLCPQCRSEVSTLYFVESRHVDVIPNNPVPSDEEVKFGVKFESEYALQCFRSYMAHKCQICCTKENSPNASVFPNFAALQQHINQVHHFSFCYLCSENLNTLTKDRRMYNREQLQRHMNGEEMARDEGFRGHPKCLFCEQRFYDDQQQYRHLRKDHYFCQICDSDGADNFFYKSHKELIQHYKREHYPCTNDECLTMGIVFRTDMELNVHRAKQHTQSGRKTMQLDFSIGTGGSGSSNSGVRGNSNEFSGGVNAQPPPASIFTIVPSAQTSQRLVRIVPSAAINAANIGEFPLLDQVQQSSYGAPPKWRQKQQVLVAKNAPRLPLQSGEQFPGLPSSSKAPVQRAAGKTLKSTVGGTLSAENTVWSKGATSQLFKSQVQKSQLQNKQQDALSSESAAADEQKRKKIIPMPEAFPAGMREILRARQLGLPEPAQPPLELSHADRYAEVKRQAKAQKKKDKKVKRVSAAAVAQKVASAKFIPQASSRFKTLCESSDEDENDEFGRPKNWWTSSGGCKSIAPTLSSTTDNFVRIDLGKQVSHRRPGGANAGNGNSSSSSMTPESSKPPISLNSIAASLQKNSSDGEKNAESKENPSNEDDLELLRHQREQYNNDYNINNEDLDLQMALEMSLISSQLFMPKKKTTTSSEKISAERHSAEKTLDENISAEKKQTIKTISDKKRMSAEKKDAKNVDNKFENNNGEKRDANSTANGTMPPSFSASLPPPPGFSADDRAQKTSAPAEPLPTTTTLTDSNNCDAPPGFAMRGG